MHDDVANWVHAWAQVDPERIAISFEGEAIKYVELSNRIDFLADRLVECGYKRGDRIAYLGENHPDVIALTFACMRIEAIFVPLNWRLSPAEIKSLIFDCTPILLLHDSKFSEAVEYAEPVPNMRLALLEYGTEVWFRCNWSELVRKKTQLSKVDLSEDVALLMYTSGTTGFPKGASHTCRGVEWTALNVIDGYALESTDKVLAYLPLFHVGGLLMLVLPAIKVGAQIILHRRFEVEQVIRDISEQKITMMLGVATTLQSMVSHRNWQLCDTTSLRLVMTGASVISEDLLMAFFSRGIVASQVFGATEMGIGTCLKPKDARRKLGSVGQAALHSVVRIMSANGSPVAMGEVGEFLVRGPGLMAHYWGQSGVNNSGIEDGWYRTGDLGTYDSEGFFAIVSRIKEMIVSGGENIYPAEIENVLIKCAEISEVAVVGRADSRWGEVPIAVAVKKHGFEISVDALRSLLRMNLSSYNHPQEIIFVEDLPRNSMGKIIRSELKKFVSTYEGSSSVKIKTL